MRKTVTMRRRAESPPGSRRSATASEHVILAVSAVTCIAASVGAWQLATGTFTPPVSDLEALGLSSWTLPALWLAATVAVPCGITAGLALRRSDRTGTAAVVSASLLAVELLVQIPFVGPDPLQAVMGVAAVGMLLFGLRNRRQRVLRRVRTG